MHVVYGTSRNLLINSDETFPNPNCHQRLRPDLIVTGGGTVEQHGTNLITHSMHFILFFLALTFRSCSHNTYPKWDNFDRNLRVSKYFVKTRMHSSRMRTGRSLTVCCSFLPGGGVLLGRGGAWSWGCVPGPGGVLLGPGGCVPGPGGVLLGPGGFSLVWGGVWSRGGVCLVPGGFSLVPGGVPGLGGGSPWSGGVPGPGGFSLVPGGAWSRGGFSLILGGFSGDPPLLTESQTRVKT